MRLRLLDPEPQDSEGTRAASPDGREPVGLSPDGSERGQSTLDFAIGMSIFLLTLVAVLAFASATMQPFTGQSQANIGLADRVADDLAERSLGDPARPHLLNATCTAEFFDDNSPSHCRHSGSNLTSRVGVKPRHHVNVTMTANVTGDADEETLCWDGGDGEVVRRGSGDCDVPFLVGSTPPKTSGNTVTARRVVTIDGVDATLRVEVW